MKQNLTIRLFEFERDYPELCEWWRARTADGWTAYIPAKSLPATGFVVEDAAGGKHAMAFLYLCESKWAWLEWLTTNPASPGRSRHSAVERILAEATAFARGAGVEHILSSLRHSGLRRAFSRAGFAGEEGGMTNMIWNAKQ